MLEEKFEVLEGEGETITDKFKRENLLRNVTCKEYENLKIEMHTHEEWNYAKCSDKFRILAGVVERKANRSDTPGERTIKTSQTQTQNGKITKICGVPVNEKGLAEYDEFRALSQKKREEFTKERRRLVDAGNLPKRQWMDIPRVLHEEGQCSRLQ